MRYVLLLAVAAALGLALWALQAQAVQPCVYPHCFG